MTLRTGRGPMDDFERLARGMGAADDQEARLALAVEAAVQLVDGCDHASVTISAGREMTFQAASDPVAEESDRLQYDLGEGPSLDSMRSNQTVVSQDLSEGDRWPRWAPQVSADLGVCSIVTVGLHAGERAFGSLNLYAARRHGFDRPAITTAQTLAGHAGVALASAREIEHLHLAVRGRTTIGQAQGILMERLGLDEAQAFAYLKRASSHTNRRVASVAADLVETRELPLGPQG